MELEDLQILAWDYWHRVLQIPRDHSTLDRVLVASWRGWDKGELLFSAWHHGGGGGESLHILPAALRKNQIQTSKHSSCCVYTSLTKYKTNLKSSDRKQGPILLSVCWLVVFSVYTGCVEPEPRHLSVFLCCTKTCKQKQLKGERISSGSQLKSIMTRSRDNGAGSSGLRCICSQEAEVQGKDVLRLS